jgi:hypothetical protein
MGTLEVSFYGPFFYNLKANPVEVYAPKCPGHKAGIFSAKSEWPLHGRHQDGVDLKYSLGGSVFTPPAPVPPINIYDPQGIILDASASAKPKYDTANFCLLVPVPQVIYGINPAPMEVVTGAVPTGKPKSQATGLRFCYNADLTQVVTLSVLGTTIWKSDFVAPALGFSQADVYVRYADNTPEDQDHEDAEECFDLIAGLGGVPWWLCYEDFQHPGLISTPFARAGNDCRAAAMIVK